MDQDLKKIKKLTFFMKNEGILNLKTSGIEIELSPSALFHQNSSEKTKDPDPEIKMSPYTDLDQLLWSAPGYSAYEEEKTHA